MRLHTVAAFCLVVTSCHATSFSQYLKSMLGGDSGIATSATTTTSTAAPTVNGTTAASACGADHFVCGGVRTRAHVAAKCIPSAWQCDSVEDCDDGSDERDCAAQATGCPAGTLTCDNRQCVQLEYRCDGKNDCGDGTDEAHCADEFLVMDDGRHEAMHGLSAHVCPLDYFLCHDDVCITAEAVCDGFKDCAGGEDETYCAVPPSRQAVACRAHEFRCASSGACIDSTWLCDGMSDCVDNSDEKYCNPGNASSAAGFGDYDAHAKCTDDEHMCLGDGSCIDKARVCDGHEQCADGSDEGAFCGHCAEMACHDGCADGPNFAVCTCREGMRLGADGESCEDVDECRDGSHTCAQHCTNVDPLSSGTHRGYLCSCATDYIQRGDECHLRAELAKEEPLVLTLLRRVLRVRPLRDDAVAHRLRLPLNLPGDDELETPMSMTLRRDVDRQFLADADTTESTDHEEVLLFSTVSGTRGRIYAMDAASHEHPKCLLDGVQGLRAISADPRTGNVYYTASYGFANTLGVCSPALQYCRTLITRNDTVSAVTTLAVSGRLGRVFWIEYDQHHEGAVMSAALNGEDVRELVHTGRKLGAPVALHVHEQADRLYIFDQAHTDVATVDVRTGKLTVVQSHGVHMLGALAVFDNELVYADEETKLIGHMLITPPGLPRPLETFNEAPLAMAVLHPSVVPATTNVRNPCHESGCSHMCVAASVGSDDGANEWAPLQPQCICPDGYALVGAYDCRPTTSPQGLSLRSAHVGAWHAADLCRRGDLCMHGVCVASAADELHSMLRAGLPVCSCHNGFEGAYCEVDVRALESSAAAVVLVLLAVIFALLIVLCVVYVRRRRNAHQDIVPSKVQSVAADVGRSARAARSVVDDKVWKVVKARMFPRPGKADLMPHSASATTVSPAADDEQTYEPTILVDNDRTYLIDPNAARPRGFDDSGRYSNNSNQ